MVWSFVPATIHCFLPKISSMFSPNNSLSIAEQGCFLFSPPYPIKKFFYRCDRKFHLSDLIKLYEIHNNYAIVLVSGKRTEFYLHSSNQTKIIKGLDVSLPNQHKTGGFSAARFGRIRDEKIGWYATKIIELMVQCYVKEGKFEHIGLIIAGPAEMKELIKDEEIFNKYFSKYLLKTITIAEITDQSIHQVIRSASDVLSTASNEKDLIDHFDQIITDPKTIDLLVFGNKEVEAALNAGQLREIYVSNSYLHKERILKTNTKTKIHIINSKDFLSKYGDLVGIMYYIPYDENLIDENLIDNNIIVEV